MDKESPDSSSQIRKDISKLAWKMADKARFHAVSHHISAEWYERLDRWAMYTSFVLGAVSIAGAGTMLSDVYDDMQPKNKRRAVVASAATSVLQAVISSLNDSSYAPRKVSEGHRRAAVELQDFRNRLDLFQVRIKDQKVDVEKIREEYSKYLEEKKKLEGDYIRSEHWTFRQVHQEISGSDKRRENLRAKIEE